MEDDEPRLRMTDMDSFIEIDLQKENAYISGEPLHGTVHIYAKDPIPSVRQVSIVFTGEEQVIMNLPDKKQGGVTVPVTRVFPIIH